MRQMTMAQPSLGHPEQSDSKIEGETFFFPCSPKRARIRLYAFSFLGNPTPMPTPLLDLAALTAPLPGDQPAGARLTADVRKKMEDARKDFEANPDDPSKPPIPKKPDWPGIVRLATDSLAKTSKELLTAVRLVEALTKREGFPGLRCGLEFLRAFVTECWDRMHPAIEAPEDVQDRAGPFEWLADTESGAWFPATIGKLPLIKVNGQLATLRDCQAGQVNDIPISSDQIKVGETATPTTTEDVTECLNELQALDKALDERMAEHAPSLAGLRDVLTECRNFLRFLEPAPSAPSEEQPADSDDGSAGAAPAQKSSGQTSRADTYRQLARLADDLAKMEPHSPIPDLLRWAVKLGGMPFRQLIQELVREPTVLADIRVRLGIPEAESQETAK
jgi:type VI secretion system protein ImpA